VELYEQYPARSEADLLAEARARGTAAARQVNRLIELGAKVIVSNLPDLAYSPYAQAQNASSGDPGRAALIGRLGAAFNEALGVSILIDGRFVGLVQLDQRTQVLGRAPAAYGYANFTSAVCATAPPLCTTATLVTDGNADTWFWAGDRWLASSGHAQLATLAIDRAVRNPF
jgi:phospholipase/lecithinase/hemolysin